MADAGSMRRRFLIMLNPTAGVPRPAFFDAVLAGLAAEGAIVTVLTRDQPADAAAALEAALPDHDAVLAAGGDGTVRHLATTIGDRRVPIGLIPLGTGNVLAHEMGLRRRPADVVATLLHGETRVVHGARANGAPFFLMAGVGFDARAVAALDYGLKRKLGRAAYVDAVVRAWRAPPDLLDIDVDGQRRRANWLIVANASRYGGSFTLAPGASAFTPGLLAVLVQAPHRLALAARLMRLARGKLAAGSTAGVEVLPAKRLTVTAGEPVPVQLDGDRFGTVPLTVDAVGPQFRLIVPSVRRS